MENLKCSGSVNSAQISVGQAIFIQILEMQQKTIKTDNKEHEFHDYFINNSQKVLKGCRLVASEFSLFPAYDVLRATSFNEDVRGSGAFGRIDLVFHYRNKTYVAEIKFYKNEGSKKPTGEFWDALKVLGYCAYFKFQTGQTSGVFPAIIMPIESIRLEHQHIASALNIKLFGIKALRGEYKLVTLTDEPYWKQFKD